jgi:hypothetical protein
MLRDEYRCPDGRIVYDPFACLIERDNSVWKLDQFIVQSFGFTPGQDPGSPECTVECFEECGEQCIPQNGEERCYFQCRNICFQHCK